MGNHDSLMAERGLYYKLIESQQQDLSPNHINDSQDPLNQIQNDSSTVISYHKLSQIGADIQDSETRNIQNLFRDDSRSTKSDISIWRMMRMNKPEWEYIVIGGIGSILLGLSAPVYAIVFGEIMGLLDQSMQEDVQRFNNLLALVILTNSFIHYNK